MHAAILYPYSKQAEQTHEQKKINKKVLKIKVDQQMTLTQMQFISSMHAISPNLFSNSTTVQSGKYWKHQKEEKEINFKWRMESMGFRAWYSSLECTFHYAKNVMSIVQALPFLFKMTFAKAAPRQLSKKRPLKLKTNRAARDSHGTHLSQLAYREKK